MVDYQKKSHFQLEQMYEKDRCFDFWRVFSLYNTFFKKLKNNTFQNGMKELWIMEWEGVYYEYNFRIAYSKLCNKVNFYYPSLRF